MGEDCLDLGMVDKKTQFEIDSYVGFKLFHQTLPLKLKDQRPYFSVKIEFQTEVNKKKIVL